MDISANMLEVAENGAIKTRIMYRAFLSFPQMKEYLDVLTESDLLEFREDEAKYYTTAQGRRFLKMYNDVGRIIAPKEARSVIAQ